MNLASSLRPLLRVLSSGGTILCYHALTDAHWTSAGIVNLPVTLFRDQIELVTAAATVVPLRELVARHRAGRSTRALVALTFDDAYASLGLVEPLIREKALPVTLFVVSGAARSGAPFWWDRLDDLHPLVSPDRWRRFEDALGVPEAFRRGQPAEFGPLRPLRQWLLAEHRGRWPTPFEALLGGLEAEMGAATRQRPMVWDELLRFVAAGPVDLGVHTRSHAVLPLLSGAELEHEIAGCFADIQERASSSVPVLAIPFGLYDARTLRLAREAGMNASLTLQSRMLRGDDAEALPRFCLTNREPGWKLLLKLTSAGAWARTLRGQISDVEPALPSETT